MLSAFVFFIIWGACCAEWYDDSNQFMQMWLTGTGIFLIVTGFFEGV